MRIRFGWGTVGGLVLNGPLLWGALKWILDWKGRIDAGEGIVSALSPFQQWYYLAALVIGLFLIWWDNKRTRKEVTIMFTPFALAIACTILAVGTWAFFLYERSLGPISWTVSTGAPINF